MAGSVQSNMAGSVIEYLNFVFQIYILKITTGANHLGALASTALKFVL